MDGMDDDEEDYGHVPFAAIMKGDGVTGVVVMWAGARTTMTPEQFEGWMNARMERFANVGD